MFVCMWQQCLYVCGSNVCMYVAAVSKYYFVERGLMKRRCRFFAVRSEAVLTETLYSTEVYSFPTAHSIFTNVI